MKRTNTIHNVVLFEGPQDRLQPAVEDFKQHFASAAEESVEETGRHRAWLHNENLALGDKPVPTLARSLPLLSGSPICKSASGKARCTAVPL